MKQLKTQRETLVRAVLSRFFEHYTVIVTLDGRYLKCPLFVRRQGQGSRYRVNPAIPDAWFEAPPKPEGCPCCGAGAPGGRRSHR